MFVFPFRKQTLSNSVCVLVQSGYNSWAVKINRKILAALLTLLLLLTQQSVVAHTVSHWSATSSSHHDEQLPHEQTCQQCIAHAQFASSLTSEYSLPAAHFATYPPPSTIPTQEIVAQTVCVFRSRAPPSA